MLRDKAGNRLFRKITVKIVYPDAIFPDKTFVQHAGPKQGFGPDGVNEMLMNIVDQLDTLYPFWDFESVELTPQGRTARYLFKFAGYCAPTTTSPTTESSTPEPETPSDIPPTTETVGTTSAVAASSEQVQS